MRFEETRNEIATTLAEAGVSNIKDLLDEVFAEAEKRQTFDDVAFLNWFNTKNVAFMSNPKGFLRKCGIVDIRAGKFDKKEVTESINMIPVICSMRDNGYDMNTDDSMYFDIYYNWLYHNGSTLDELRNLHESIVKYLEANNKRNSKDYIDVLRRSKFIKSKRAPVADLDALALKSIQEWNAIIADLDEAKSKVKGTAMSNEEIAEMTKDLLKESEI